MRIRLFSDLHLEFADFQPPALDCDLVVLAGDIHVGAMALPWIRQHFDVPVIYVLGNHEFYRHVVPGLYQSLDQLLEPDDRIEILENRSVRVADTEFFGCTLWTDFDLFGQAQGCQRVAAAMMSDYTLIRCGHEQRTLTPADTIEYHHMSRSWLSQAVAASDARHKVVVSHHAPSLQSVSPAFTREPVSAAYASAMEAYVETLGVDLWLHGHTHRCVDYRIGPTRVVTNQRGYQPFDPVADFQPDFSIEI